MTETSFPQEGGCRCGKVHFSITALPMMTSVCHCTGCQKMTASAFSTTLTVPVDGFAVTAGEPVIGGLHGDEARHHHCDWCKSWVFTKLPPEYGAINVRATTLDDSTWFAPYMEVFTSEKQQWAETGAVRSFARAPEPQDYPVLMAEYAAR